MLRSLLPVVLVVSSGCTLHHARLESSRDLVITRTGDGLCGPIGIRRASLGARWGEYVRVSVAAPAPVSGEARLHVDGRAYPLQRFTTEPQLMGAVQVAAEGVQVEVPAVLPVVATSQTIVLDAAWTNERLDVPTALGAGHVIDITLAGLTTPRGSCRDVVFTVEQGVFQPTVDERAWVAELTRRGGPELQAWLAAEETRKAGVRAQVFLEAERRKVAWAAELEARREASRVEAVARAEAARVEVLARVEVEQREALRREEVRQAHYAEYERRREARVEGSAGVAVAAPAVQVSAPVLPAPKRALVCRAPQSSRGSFGGSGPGPVTSVPMVAEESCEEVADTATASSAFAAASGSVEVTSSQERVTRAGVAGDLSASTQVAGRETRAGGVSGGAWTQVPSQEGRASELSGGASASEVTGGASVSAAVGVSMGAEVSLGSEGPGSTRGAGGQTLEARPVSSESVAAAPAMEVEAYPEWSTPQSFQVARVAVATEQVTPAPSPPCPPPAPRQVTAVEPRAGLALLHLFGALVNVAAQVHATQPVHPSTPVQQPVHQASPVQPR
ncbi:MAG: hypothetical protein JNJ54_30070 [Myxococcaceae bacterium]|nr:hypothetical protein [Myxococcaceae bacterium]